MLEFLINNDSNLFVGAGVAVAAVMAVKYMNARADAAQQRAYEAAKARQEALKAEREKPIKRRFFTPEEMLPFNGEDGQPIYIAVLDEVYDVSRKRDFYGPGEGYHLFAGRDASRALAKMSFEQEDLDSEDLSDLSFMDKETLQDWVTKFSVYNSYPNVGRVLRRRDLTLEQLKPFNGVDNPRKIVYVAVNGNIYDVTLDGMNHYGPDGGYKQFAGRDCSRSLACMSFVDEYLDNPTVDGLTEQQQETLNKWEEKFQEKYPVVGKVINDVYDVSASRNEYGPSGRFAALAGRDITKAVATNGLDDEKELASLDLSNLTPEQFQTLDEWLDKFQSDEHKYANVGRLVDSNLHLTPEDLLPFNGADNPRKMILVGVNGVLYDVTLNGSEFYGLDGMYGQFAGRDASRALACMSLEAETLDDPTLDQITPEQRKTLDDWIKRFEGKYAVVGKLSAARRK
ncbi:hypothetical protein BBI17_003226 [Phytophthora kernoviae]|uniref:Cytochrome b5 heme-binding domain-containing protein n=2 Tax=Phytophthora kernoviae TaxID=325452 RepID=A0A3R7JA11_9STRA|nr:hypothetical protein G195_001119 [Phytophthora kernoviae 00238/432]KAG2529958.1 hypothetical protein JM18_002467 [Phytophthora kernoviae]RLN44711.1 hypothetical protein BBI17_003226 [Phytophthora kernoviae]